MIEPKPINCLTFNLQRAARAATRRLEAALEPLGLTAQQFTALAMLSGHRTLTSTKLADLTGTDRTTISRNLSVLRRRGLIADIEDRHDRRVAAVSLSDEGRAVFDRAMPLWRQAQEANLARLDPQAAVCFLDALREI